MASSPPTGDRAALDFSPAARNDPGMPGNRISVIIPTYNLGPYILETVESALAQSHADREIIVVDDGSTDDTEWRLGPYRDQIRYVRQEHAGLAAGLNHGLRLAGGDYIAILDGDDLWTRRKLEFQIAVAHATPECGMIVCDGVEFEGSFAGIRREGETRRHLLPQHLRELLSGTKEGIVSATVHQALIYSPQIGCPAQTMIPRAIVETIGPFVDLPSLDYDYQLRISQRFPIAFQYHLMVGYRYRPDSISGPQENRRLVRNQRLVPLLRAHAARCDNNEDRQLVEEAIRRYEDGIAGALREAPTAGAG